MTDIQATIEQYKIVPVIALDDAEKAGALADALVRGDLPIAEVTFRTAAAESAIRTMADRGDMLVGAGTVLTTEQAERAVAAGATFLVSPGTNPAVVRKAQELGVPMYPGIATPTDIELGMSLGLTTLKFFPAEAAGGVKMLKAIGGPYKKVRFMPTGGINAGNLTEYLSLPNVVACGGSWMVSKTLLANSDWDSIAAASLEARELVTKMNA